MDALLTPALTSQAAELAREGLPASLIAAKLRVGRRTFFDWLTKGEAQAEGEERPPYSPDYAAFYLSVQEARADAGLTSIRRVRTERGSTGDAWWLERAFPAEFGTRTKLEVEHSGTVQIIDWSTNAAGALAERMAEVPAIDAEFSSVDALAITTTKPGG